jgi:hypothetical protein
MCICFQLEIRDVGLELHVRDLWTSKFAASCATSLGIEVGWESALLSCIIPAANLEFNG